MKLRAGPLIATTLAVALLCAACSSDSDGAAKGKDGSKGSTTTADGGGPTSPTSEDGRTTTTRRDGPVTSTTKPPTDGLVEGDPLLDKKATGLDPVQLGPPFNTFMGKGLITRDQMRANLLEGGAVRVWPVEAADTGFENVKPKLEGEAAADLVVDATFGIGDPTDCWDNADAPPVQRLGGNAFGPNASILQRVQQFATEADAQRYFATYADPGALGAQPGDPQLVYTIGDDAMTNGQYSSTGCGPGSMIDTPCKGITSCVKLEGDGTTSIAARKGQWIVELQLTGDDASRAEDLIETSLGRLK